MAGKIGVTHQARRAMVYVRQSSMGQVRENTESTSQQYALAERAQSLGWAADDVVVIDEDLGKSGASAEGRSGLARLAREVAQGRVGAILALEVSRFARSSPDWQQLLRLCAVADVLVLDDQSVYHPALPDDRLLLDLKGTMSAAELQWLRLRLAGARRSKARRGELWFQPATGYIWTAGRLLIDPDEATSTAIRVVLERFELEPSSWAVVRWARRNNFLLPTTRYHAGGHTEVVWGPLGASRLCSILHNPIYAGTYAYGRSVQREVLVDGQVRRVRVSSSKPGDWLVCIVDAHPGYISWQQYQDNLRSLRACAQAHGKDRRKGPPGQANLYSFGRVEPGGRVEEMGGFLPADSLRQQGGTAGLGGDPQAHEGGPQSGFV